MARRAKSGPASRNTCGEKGRKKQAAHEQSDKRTKLKSKKPSPQAKEGAAIADGKKSARVIGPLYPKSKKKGNQNTNKGTI